MKKRLFFVVAAMVVLALVFVLAGCGQSQPPAEEKKTETTPAPAPAPEVKKISIATASVGGSYYPIGVGMAEVTKQFVPNTEASVVVTGGGAENPKLVGEGENDIGISNTNYVYDAYNGEGSYTKKYGDLRVLFTGISPGAVQCVVKENSPIKSYKDLKGKKVAVGPQGGGSIHNLAKCLEMYGIKIEDVKTSFMGYDDGFTALQNGQVDAAMNTSPLPTAGVKSLQAAGFKFRVLGVEDEITKKIFEKYPYYNPVTIPKDMYGLSEDIKLFGTTNLAIVNAKLSDDLVYTITKAIFEHLDVVGASHPSAKSIKLENAAKNSPIPLHPGAEKYFKEKGVL